MKTLTATQLKTNTGDFFDALISDGEVILTRNGKQYPLKLIKGEGEDTRTGSQKIVDTLTKLAESIPEDKREELHVDMLEELTRCREDS